MDAITDFLSAVRVQGACYGRVQVSAPWAPRAEPALHANFGLISYGETRLNFSDGSDPIHLVNGDFFLLAPGREYELSTDGEDATTAIIAGKFTFEEAHGRPVTQFLPPLILIRGGQPR